MTPKSQWLNITKDYFLLMLHIYHGLALTLLQVVFILGPKLAEHSLFETVLFSIHREGRAC